MKNLSLDSLVYGWNMYIADNDIDDMSKEEKEIVLAAEKILKELKNVQVVEIDEELIFIFSESKMALAEFTIER